jgi:hypothetical protein
MPVEGGIDPGRDRELPTPCAVDATPTGAVPTRSGIDAARDRDDAGQTGVDPGQHREDAGRSRDDPPWGSGGPDSWSGRPDSGIRPLRLGDQDGATPGSGRRCPITMLSGTVTALHAQGFATATRTGGYTDECRRITRRAAFPSAEGCQLTLIHNAL